MVALEILDIFATLYWPLPVVTSESNILFLGPQELVF